MKFSNFLFPESRSREDDGRTIKETLAEAQLSDSLGFDVIWLAEHHFDGICAYVDPVTFAAALAVATSRASIGFAVAQMALHHPTRFAEQMALIDNISNGRLIVGLGRGTAYNVYDYQGFGIDPAEAQARLEEAEAFMIKAWHGGPLVHKGRHFDLKVPDLRPAPLTRPHPRIIRAASSEHGMVEIARAGRPFMMNVQSDAVVQSRMDLYRRTLREAGFGSDDVARLAGQCWIWRNVVVAETDAEAERIAVPAFTAMIEQRAAMRERVRREQGISIAPPSPPGAAPSARTTLEHGLVYGSPVTVARKLTPILAARVGGMIIQFRLGPMSFSDTAKSLRLFQQVVVPHLEK